MVREILTISIGQGGVQLGNHIWKQYIAEHKVKRNGLPGEGFDHSNENFLVFFEHTNLDMFVPRNLCVDLEPNVLDDIRKGPYAAIFHPDYLVNGKEDAANNFARGHYTIGKAMMEIVDDRIRKMVDRCENVQGFLVNHAVGGGTGSGMGMLILERLAADYRKKSKIGFELYPSPNISNCIVEPYNGLLSTHWLLDHTDVSLVLDNEALYGICQNKLNIPKPSYHHLNNIISKVVSSMTAALRYDGELNNDMNDFQTNLVPFPRLHFMTTSLAPIFSAQKVILSANDCRTITDDCLQAESFLVKYNDFDVTEDKYMAISLNYRGSIKAQNANSTVQWVKQHRKVCFVEWCPTGFKIGLTDIPAAKVDDDAIGCSEKTAIMIGNNVAVNRVFTERLSKKYDLMYSQRAYVHWYVGEGMEEGEFAEAREDLGFLEKDYIDVISEQPSDEEELGDNYL